VVGRRYVCEGEGDLISTFQGKGKTSLSWKVSQNSKTGRGVKRMRRRGRKERTPLGFPEGK